MSTEKTTTKTKIKKRKPQLVIEVGISEIGEEKYGGWNFIAETEFGKVFRVLALPRKNQPNIKTEKVELVYFGKNPQKAEVKAFHSYSVLVKDNGISKYTKNHNFEVVKQKIDGTTKVIHFVQIMSPDQARLTKDGPTIQPAIIPKSELIDIEIFSDQYMEIIRKGHNIQGHSYRPKGLNIRCSQVGSCKRYIQLDEWFVHLPKKVQQKTIEVTNKRKIGNIGPQVVGSFSHDGFEKSIEIANLKGFKDVQLLSSEQKLTTRLGENPSFNLSGHYDQLIRWNNKIFVADLKTVDPTYWDWLLKEGKMVKDDHLEQLMMYQHMLGRIDGLMIYVSKDKYKPFVHQQNYKLSEVERIVKELEKYFRLKQKSQLSPRLFDSNAVNVLKFPCLSFSKRNKQISYECKYFHYCYGEAKF